MRKRTEAQLEKERELRNISDYIYSCFLRIENEIELVTYLKKNKKLSTKENLDITASLCDVYSRDIITTLNHIIDEDIKTSSLFTLVEKINKPLIYKKYKTRLKLIKNELGTIIRLRNNQISHFSTKSNVYEKGLFPVHRIYIIMSSKDTKKILKEFESFYWDIKSELKIEGLMMYHTKNLLQSFQKLIKIN